MRRYKTAALTAAALGSLSFQALGARPTPPGTPSASLNGDQVSLTWTASTDDNRVLGYNVYLNEVYQSTVLQNRYSAAIDTSRTNTFYITAFDEPLADEQTSYSKRSTALVLRNTTGPQLPETEPDTDRPSAPAALTLISKVDGVVSIEWNPSTDNVGVSGYNVYKQGAYVSTVYVTQFVDNDATTGIENNYAVVAFDAASNYSPLSAELSVFVPGPDPTDPQTPPDPVVDDVKPSIPEGLAVISATEEAVRLTWTAATDNVGVDGYNVYRNEEYLATVFDTVFVDAEPVMEDSVRYSVASFDDARNFSPISDPVVVEGLDPDVPGVPGAPVDPVDLADGEVVPVFDPTNRFPSPNPNDPYGSLLEIDPEVPVSGGPPTTPKNLRIDLVSNNWAEFSWAPANDDTGVASYNIYRDDGVTYVVSPDQTDPDAGAQAEIDKYWSTTSFIDCNFTRFDTLVHNCRANQPVPGKTYVYQVSAVDIDGQESEQSAPLSITYHLPENAAVPLFDDFYKQPDDRFAQTNSLSETRFFLDEFDLVFSDEFEGSVLDATKWQTELTWKDTFIINGEQQYFVRIQDDPEFGYDPFSFDGEVMTISAIPTPDELREKLPSICSEADPSGKARCEFLSGALSSHDRFSFLYGYVEGRMKVGATPGMLSSFYLYHRYKGQGAELNAPEIDIIEYLGENPYGDEDAFQTYHFDDVNTGLTRSAPTMSYENPDGELYSDDFHTYGVLWEPQLVVWYIDGKEVKRMTGPMVSRRQMNLVNYLVAGSSWAPTPDVTDPDIFPLELDVDYIRVYQRDLYKGTAIFGSNN